MHKQRKLKVSTRSSSGENAIRFMLSKNLELDAQRKEKNLPPLISLGIGAPHIPANPLVDIALDEWAARRRKLKADISSNTEDSRSSAKQLLSMDTYQPAQGIPSCRHVVAELLNVYYPKLNAEAKNICICNGATHALNLLFQLFVEDGVGVGCFSPLFPPYKKQVESMGGTFIAIPTNEQCRPSAKILEEYLNKHPEITVLILNDPCNPTGVKLTREEIKEMSEVLDRPENRDIVIISDETYHDLIFGECKDLFLHAVDYDRFKKRTCVVLSLAKAIAGCPGLRLGIAYAPDMIIDGVVEQLGPKMGVLILDSTAAVSTMVQYITEFVIRAKLGDGRKEHVEIQKRWEASIIKVYSTSIKLGEQILGEYGFPMVVKPEGAFFGFISASSLIGKKVPQSVELLDGRTVTDLPTKVLSPTFQTDVHIAMFLLYAAEVVTVPGSGFVYDEKKGHLRVSFAISEAELKTAAKQMGNAVRQVV